MKRVPGRVMGALALLAVALLTGAWALRPGPAPRRRVVEVVARRYAYSPSRIIASRGDTLVIRLSSADVTHGFYLEGYGLNTKVRPQYPYFWRITEEGEEEEVSEVTVVTDRTGKFRYRCSYTCGSMHPFMQGELVVRPNRLYPTAVGTAFGLAALLMLIAAGGSSITAGSAEDGAEEGREEGTETSDEGDGNEREAAREPNEGADHDA